MRVERYGEVVAGIVLSRRNLLALLAKLDGEPGDSHHTIVAPTQYGEFFVSAEEDAEHYHHPEREARGCAGAMHPDTEERIVVSKTRVEQVSDEMDSPFGPHVIVHRTSFK